MSLNPLALEVNLNGSLKKYFVDSLEKNGVKVSFDISLAAPDVRSQGSNAVRQWYNIDFGQFGRGALSDYTFMIYCLSRQDAEGKRLSVMCDILIDFLVDSTRTDGLRRIPFYDISKTPWELLTNMIVQEISEDKPFMLPEDETKVKIYTVRLRWGTAI
ncbi:MAG: hypothetical protein LLG05_09595 [Porphyromonadaceae bacterium]|nr:hypothetical protein [Porphyromonadaceae bacterium]